MNFSKAKDTYRQNAIVQRQMAVKLMQLLAKFSGKEFNNIFEIGCGTGFLTDEITKNLDYKGLYLNDITENFTNITPTRFLQGNIEEIEIPSDIDLIISSAVFQWVQDFDFLLKKFNTSDVKTLAFSSFGEENYKQIKDLTGYGLNYVKFDEILQTNGFEIIHFEQELQTLYFNNAKEVLNHIKSTGVGTFNGQMWTKNKFETFKSDYLNKFSDDNGFELTYNPVFYIAQKI